MFSGICAALAEQATRRCHGDFLKDTLWSTLCFGIKIKIKTLEVLERGVH